MIAGFRIRVLPGLIWTDSGYGIVVEDGAICIVRNVQFGSCPGTHIIASNASYIVLMGNIIIEAGGNAPQHIAVVSSAIMAVSGQPTLQPSLYVLGPVSIYEFASASDGWLNIHYYGQSNPGYVSGYKYASVLNGVINTNGAGTGYLPGNIAGFTSYGGLYI